MRIDILTLFPEVFDFFNHSILGKAKEKNLLEINAVNIRDYSLNKHKKVDDYPYGGVLEWLWHHNQLLMP